LIRFGPERLEQKKPTHPHQKKKKVIEKVYGGTLLREKAKKGTGKRKNKRPDQGHQEGGCPLRC